MSEFLNALQAHAWVLVASIAVGFFVRLLKSDAPLPIAAKWRAWVALALGIVAGVLTSIVGGKSAFEALAGGLAAGLLAIGGHETVIEGLRSGKELFAKTPSAPKPPLVQIIGATLWLMIGVCALLLAGCASWFRPSKIVDIVEVEQCADAHESLPPLQLVELCGFQDEQQVIDFFSAKHDAELRHKASLCAPAPTSSSVAP